MNYFHPKVTALVSVYKGERYIEKCLENLTRQSLFQTGQLEVLILNADSPENEEKICRKFVAKYPNQIRYKRLDRRFNLYETWNFGAELAQGEFLTSANVDDCHEPKCLEHLARRLDEEPSVGMVYGHQTLGVEETQDFGKCRIEDINLKPTFFPPMVLLQNPCGSQPMWRKKLHDELGGFDERFQILGDYDFVIRAASRTQIQLVNEAMGLFLDRASSLSRSGMGTELNILKKRYYNGNEILRLYGIKKGESLDAIVARFEDLIARSLLYFTVWGGEWSMRGNYELAEIAAQELEQQCSERGQFWLEIIEQLKNGEVKDNIFIQLEDYLLEGIGNNLDLMTHPELATIHTPTFPSDCIRAQHMSLGELSWRGCGLNPKSIHQLLKLQRTIVIWGFGESGRKLLKLLKGIGIDANFIVDRNRVELEKEFTNLKFISPSDLSDLVPKAFVIISSGDRKNVQIELETIDFIEGEDYL